MEVIISGRHLEVGAEDRDYADAKLKQLADEYGKLTTGRLVIDHERGRIIAEGHIQGKHMTMNATAKADDIRVAIDGVFEKLEKQLRRYLERMQMHRGPSLGEAEVLAEESSADSIDDADLETEDALAEEDSDL